MLGGSGCLPGSGASSTAFRMLVSSLGVHLVMGFRAWSVGSRDEGYSGAAFSACASLLAVLEVLSFAVEQDLR